MEVQIGQKLYAPNPAGDGRVLATVVKFGDPDDAVDVMIEGKPIKRDVAIVQYEEGEQEGFVGYVRYEMLSPIGERGDG